MRTSRLLISAALLVAVLGTGLASPAHAQEHIPLATFIANRDVADAKLSPSGKHVALAVVNKSGRTILAASDVDTDKPPVVVAASSIADIQAFEWVNDDWLVYNVVDLQSPMRTQDFGPGLFSVRRDGSGARHLIRVLWNEFTTGTNIASTLLDPGKVEIVTGVNLPMVIKLAEVEEGAALVVVARHLRETGQASIHIASDLLAPRKPA